MDARGPEAPGGDTLRDTVSGDPRATSLLGARVLEGGLGGEMWAAGSGRPAGGGGGLDPTTEGAQKQTPPPTAPPHTTHTPRGSAARGAARQPLTRMEQASGDGEATLRRGTLCPVGKSLADVVALNPQFPDKVTEGKALTEGSESSQKRTFWKSPASVVPSQKWRGCWV